MQEFIRPSKWDGSSAPFSIRFYDAPKQWHDGIDFWEQFDACEGNAVNGV